MIVVSIAGVITAFAMPYMKDTIRNQRVRAAVSEAHLSLLFARSEAIKRNANIVVAKTGATWDLGWQVKVQSDGTVLRTSDALKTVTVDCNTDGDTSAETCPASVTFTRTGRPASILEYRFYIADNINITMRCVSISLSGQPHVSIDTDGDPVNGCTE